MLGDSLEVWACDAPRGFHVVAKLFLQRGERGEGLGIPNPVEEFQGELSVVQVAAEVEQVGLEFTLRDTEGWIRADVDRGGVALAMHRGDRGIDAFGGHECFDAFEVGGGKSNLAATFLAASDG